MPVFDEWIVAEPGEDDASVPLDHPALRAIVRRRGYAGAGDYRRFATPSVDDLHDPAGIHGMDFACSRIERAVRDGEGIVIYGDYDVDGVTSIVLLRTVLRAMGADAGFVVPHRLVDGYGLKMEVLDRVLSERNVRLVITVDCGITSVEPVNRAIERGIDVIITDHHLPPGVLPGAAAVLNPRQPGCSYPFKDLAGVGVAFKLCCELIRRNGLRISTESLLKIAAIGTIADVAPLTGENRTIAWLGLRGLAVVRNPGLRALLRKTGVYGRPLRASDVGFKIGPRINAAGRLASADTAIDLFAAADDDSAWALVGELDRMNAERQTVEQQVRETAETQIRGGERVVIVAGEGWHRGVIGLTAGRIAQRLHRPTLAIAIDGGRCVGSARSIPTINLHEQLEGVADLFSHFGGHEFACGFSLDERDLPALRERLAASFDALDDGLFVKAAAVDALLPIADVDRRFLAGHAVLEPFGAGNPQPLFAAEGLQVTGSRTFGRDCCEVTLAQGAARIPAIVWPSVRQLTAEMTEAGSCDVLFQVEPDSYAPGGAKLIVVDARPSAGARPSSA